jgi:metallo-beta-lactamase family protein
MLLDSAHIQEFEAEWKNRKAERAGRQQVEPLYSRIDAENAIKCFVSVEYEQEKIIAEGITIRFVDAGHLLGSSSIEVTITEDGVTKKIIFSGDIGNTNQPLISDPVYLKGADYVVMESTYGDRTHERPEHADYAAALADVIQRTFDRGGNVVIPSFAVGRTQEMLYFIRQIKQEGLVYGHDGFQVWVDSPLAIEATNIFRERMNDDFDKEAMELLRQGINPIGFDGLKVAVTSEESKAINDDKQPKIIISASGMCDAGRIKHHLKHNLWREESTVLFVGYQAVGTPGRAIVDGADSVKLFGEEIEVRAEICQLPGVSGHADDVGLMAWIKAMEERPKMVFVTHGEDKVTEFFRDRLINELGLNAYAPFSGTRFDLASGTFEVEAEPVQIEKEEAQARQAVRQDGGSQVRPVVKGEDGLKRISSKNKKAIHAYARLTAAGERLLAVIRHNEGGANKDINKLTEEILRLCDKWDR